MRIKYLTKREIEKAMQVAAYSRLAVRYEDTHMQYKGSERPTVKVALVKGWFKITPVGVGKTRRLSAAEVKDELGRMARELERREHARLMAEGMEQGTGTES